MERVGLFLISTTNIIIHLKREGVWFLCMDYAVCKDDQYLVKK